MVRLQLYIDTTLHLLMYIRSEASPLGNISGYALYYPLTGIFFLTS